MKGTLQKFLIILLINHVIVDKYVTKKDKINKV